MSTNEQRDFDNVLRMSTNEENDFDRALGLLSIDIIPVCYAERPVTFDWYYNDHLYTNIKFVALIDGNIAYPKWQYPYAFWSLSMGPIIQARHYFKLRYWNGFYVVFDDLTDTQPFEGDLSTQVEEMLRDDVGQQKSMELVRDICQQTGVLITPQFVTLSRRARGTVYTYGDMANQNPLQDDSYDL
jgi:hypothetical protein